MKTKLLLLTAVLSASMPAARAINYYWDANGTTPGAGVTPNGTWGTDDFWNTSGIGGAGTFTNTMTSADIGVFSAGTDATGSYTVGLNGTQTAAALYLNFGSNVVLTNGLLALARTNGSSTNVGAINTGTNMTGTATIASGILLDTSAANTVLHLNAGNGAAATDLLVTGDISASVPATSYVLRLNGAGGGRIESALTDGNAVLGGTIQVGSAPWTGIWTIAGNQSLGAVAITLSGENKLVMGDTTADVQSWSGVTTVATNTALLTVKSTATMSNATLRGGGVLAVGGSLTGGMLTLGGTNGPGVLQLADGVTGGSATFSGYTLSGTGNKIVGGAGGTGTLGISPGTALTFGAAVALGGAGANENDFNIVKTGAGAFILAASNSFTGFTRLDSGGAVVLADQNALQGSTLTPNGGGGVFFSNSVAGNAFTVGGLAATSSVSGFNIGLTNSAGAAIALTVGGNNQSTAYAGLLFGAGSLVKTGTGTLTLTGANSYAGGTTVNSGALAGPAGSLQRDIVNNARVIFQQPSGTGTYSNTVSGSGALAKTGAGTLLLSGTNSYAGETTVEEGTLQINSTGQIAATGAVQVSNGATLLLNRASAPLVFSNAIAGAGRVVKAGSNNVTLASANAHTGGTVISNANLILAANGALGTGALGLDSATNVVRLLVNGTTNTVTNLVVAGTNAQVIQNDGSGGSQGRLTFDLASGVTAESAAATIIRDRSDATNSAMGTLALVKNGAGTLVLRGTTAHTGGTTVGAGRVEFAAGSSTVFVVGASGVNNAIGGAGAATFDGQFLFDLAGASTNTNATWTIVQGALGATYGTNFLVGGFNGAGGNWTNTTNGVDYVFRQSTGVLSVQASGGGNYSGWVGYWQGVDPGFTNTAPAADPDGDSFSNEKEFAFDGNPSVGSPAMLTASKSGTNAVFNFVARKDPPGGATYQVQATTNLATGPWTNSSVTVSNSANQAGLNIPADYERREFVVPASGRHFYRVEASVGP